MQTRRSVQPQHGEANLSVVDRLVPPNSIDAEQAVLGAILFNPLAITNIVTLVKPKDFYKLAHANIFNAMTSLFRKGEPIDIITVSEWMNDENTLDASGGRTYLMDLAMSVSTSENVVYYARIIKDHSVSRQLINIGSEISNYGYEHPAEHALELSQNLLLEISDAATSGNEKTQADQWEEVLSEIENPEIATGTPTGFTGIDALLRGRGLQPGLFILAARPSMGKSALALNIATNIALTGKPALFFSLEMSFASVGLRVAANIAEVNIENKEAVKRNWHRIPKDNLVIHDLPTLSISSLRAMLMREIVKRGKLGVVVIDYLQLMEDGDTKDNENTRLEKRSRALKKMSREFNVPIIALSQLSRAVEGRQDKRPMLSDLRSSGAIEQDADVVAFIYRDEYYNKDSDRPGTADISIAKQRDGAIGNVDLLFRSQIVKFINPAISSTRVF
jgi:replicative DNA helicase